METTKKEFEPKHYSVVSDIWFYIRFYRKHEPVVLLCCVIEILLSAVLPLLSIYLPKITIDLVEKGVTAGRIAGVLGAYTLFMMLLYGLNSGISNGKYNLYTAQLTNLMGLYFLKSLRIPYADVESGEIKKVYWKAYDATQGGDWSAGSRMVYETVTLSVNALSFLLYSTVIGYLSVPMLLVLLVLSLVNYAVSMRYIKFVESMREESALAQKHFYCVLNAMSNVKGAKDIRIFGMKNWMLGLRDVTLGELKKLTEKTRKKNAFYEKSGFALAAVRNLGAYAYLLYQASQGVVSAGEFVLYFGAITGFSGFVNGIMGSLASLRDAANGTDYIRTYLELPEENRALSGMITIGDVIQFAGCFSRLMEAVVALIHGFSEFALSARRQISTLELIEMQDEMYKGKLPLEKRSDHEYQIEFKNVSFKYPGSEKYALKNLSMKLKIGEKLAIVGMNGSGKTTMIKLLCRLYDPDEGEILLNGVDIKKFKQDEYSRLFSVVFQDFTLYPFPLAQNVAVSRSYDGALVEKCLRDADFGTRLSALEKGADTYLYKDYDDSGIEISGGEAQKIAIARAIYKDAPFILLDEPTAALDPLAEYEIYTNFDKIIGTKTAIYISHRLSSCRFCEKIAVFDEGALVQFGSHDELVADLHGKYYELWNAQAQYYKEE